MAVRISDMTPLAALQKDTKFEVMNPSDGKSYSVTAEVIKNYNKNSNNGSYKGETTASLDSMMAKEYLGIWWWHGTGGPNNAASGMVEVIAAVGPEDNPNDFIMRFSIGNQVYQRTSVNHVISAWASLTNRNGCRIQYDVSNSADVTFPVQFSGTPSVVAVPIGSNGTPSVVNVINVTGVSATGFHVTRFSSDTAAAGETTNSTTTSTVDQTSGTETKNTTSTTITSRGAWTNGDFAYYWIAVLEEG